MKYYSVTEIYKILGRARQTVENWINKCLNGPALVKGNRKFYTEEDLNKLRIVEFYSDNGYELDDIKDILDNGDYNTLDGINEVLTLNTIAQSEIDYSKRVIDRVNNGDDLLEVLKEEKLKSSLLDVLGDTLEMPELYLQKYKDIDRKMELICRFDVDTIDVFLETLYKPIDEIDCLYESGALASDESVQKVIGEVVLKLIDYFKVSMSLSVTAFKNIIYYVTLENGISKEEESSRDFFIKSLDYYVDQHIEEDKLVKQIMNCLDHLEKCYKSDLKASSDLVQDELDKTYLECIDNWVMNIDSFSEYLKLLIEQFSEQNEETEYKNKAIDIYCLRMKLKEACDE